MFFRPSSLSRSLSSVDGPLPATYKEYILQPLVANQSYHFAWDSTTVRASYLALCITGGVLVGDDVDGGDSNTMDQT